MAHTKLLYEEASRACTTAAYATFEICIAHMPIAHMPVTKKPFLEKISLTWIEFLEAP